MAQSPEMRAFIRHPTEIPIELRSLDGNQHEEHDRMHDVSVGGLCCLAQQPFSEGERVSVHIPVGEPSFEIEGRVAWCRRDQDYYRVGVAFADEARAFSARMVEQVCHIGSYHRQQREQGHDITEEQAALEWIEKFGASFPR